MPSAIRNFIGTGQSIPLTLPYQSLTVNGTASLAGPLTLLGDLTVGPSADLDIGPYTLIVAGNLDAGNTITGAGGATVQMTGSGKTLKGTLPTLELSGAADVTVIGTTTVNGNLTTLFPSGHLSFGAAGTGSRVMTVTGDADFQGVQTSMHDDTHRLNVGGTLTIADTPNDTSLTGGVFAVAGHVHEDDNGFRAFGTTSFC